MMKQHLSNGTAKGGGLHIDINELTQMLSQHIGREQAEFYAQAIHKEQGTYLEETSRFARLVEWIDNEIRNAGIVINDFSPADKTDTYNTAQYKLWDEHVSLIGKLLVFRAFLVDSRSTTQQRRNIEYTACKIFGIHYNEDLGVYV